MPRVPFAEYQGMWQGAAARAVTWMTAAQRREADLRARLAAAGLPDDQVPPAPVEDTDVVAFMTTLSTFEAAETPEPGGEVEVPTPLPDVPADPTPVPAPDEPPLPTEPTEPGEPV